MKKKVTQKLSLHRDTLRTLNEEQLPQVDGGAPSLQYSRCETCGIYCSYNTCNPSTCG